MPEEAPVTTATRPAGLVLCMSGGCFLRGGDAGGSGFGDRPAEALEGDGFGLRAAALVGIEGVDGGDLVAGEGEVEDVEVLGDAVRLGRLRDDRAALLQVPAQHHLRRRLPARLGDAGDDWVL